MTGCQRGDGTAVDLDAAKRVATLQRVAWALRSEAGTVTVDYCEQHLGWHVNLSEPRPITPVAGDGLLFAEPGPNR